jgi:hypothetical protein
MRAQPMTPFAVHLSAWMVSCLEDGWIKRINEKLIRWEAEKSNYMIRLMLNDNTVTEEEIKNWKPAWGFRWQNRLNTTSYVSFLGPDYYNKFRKLNGEFRKSNMDDINYNCIDKDILFKLKNLNTNYLP